MAEQAKKLEALLERQKNLEWDLDHDLPWESLNPSLPLLPLETLAVPSSLTSDERLALSQFLGLMAIAAIAEHENILGVIREKCTPRISASLLPLAEQFFKEEAKHSDAFFRYVSSFAQRLNIPMESLKKILPRLAESSWITRAFLVNHFFGGRAIWHLVQATELESIDLYRYLKTSGGVIEPLYFDLNRLHYEEETRHISVPPLILAAAKKDRGEKFDRKFARALHLIWAFFQFFRLGHLRSLRTEHPFFRDVHAAYQKMSFRQKLALFRHTQIYILGGRRLHTQLERRSNES
jgi:hypothetical protein